MVGLNQNMWRIKLFSPKYSFNKIGEGLVGKREGNIKANQNPIYTKKKCFLAFSNRTSLPTFLTLVNK